MKKRYFSLSILILLSLSFVLLIGVTYNKHHYLQEAITGRVPLLSGGGGDYCVGDCYVSSNNLCPSGTYNAGMGTETGECTLGEICCVPDSEFVCAAGAGLCDAACSSGTVEVPSYCPEDQVCCVDSRYCDGELCDVPIPPTQCGNGICEMGETCEGCIEDCEGEGGEGIAGCQDDYLCSKYDFFGNYNPGCQLECGSYYPAVCFHEQANCFNFGYEYTSPVNPTICGIHSEGCCKIVPSEDEPLRDSSCGNGICELSKGESCDECYIDCQGLRADCGVGKVCLYDDVARDPICKVSCSNSFACGCFERDCPRSGEGYEFTDYSGDILFDYFDITGHNPDGYVFDINWNCAKLEPGWPYDPPEQGFELWRECRYSSEGIRFMEVIESDTPGYCNDGTPEKHCSLTQPLYCKNDRLINSCEECGCSRGYYCGEQGKVCLINQSYIEINETPQLSPGEDEDPDFNLWEQLRNTYGIDDRGSAVSATILRKFAEGNDKGVLKSPGKLLTEVVRTKDVDSVLKLSEESVEKADQKIKRTSQIFEQQNSDEIGDLLFEGDEGANIGLIGNVVANAAAQSNQTNESPDLSPPLEIPDIDPIDIPCVNETEENCLGQAKCCAGLVCTSGVCLANDNVTAIPINVTINNGTVENIDDDYGFSDLVGVQVRGDSGGVSVTEYETHPVEVRDLEIPEAVTFGFYDIKAENEIGASLSFEVLNDLLVANQVVAVGLYRLTDDGWQSLDLEDIAFSKDRTRFTFNTEGFSFFTLKGVKEGINFEAATEQEPSLWSVYRRSFTPGFSLVEFFIGKQDTIIFGIFNGAPLIDLGLSGFS